jgi:hypothetical protein
MAVTSLKPPSPEVVHAATERVRATGRVAVTDVHVAAMTMWSVCEEQGLLDDPRCELARTVAWAVFDSMRAAFKAETGKGGDYLEVLAWQASKDAAAAER